MKVLHIGSNAKEQLKDFFERHNSRDDLLFVFHDCTSFVKDTNGDYSKEVNAKKLAIRKWGGVDDFLLLKQSFDRICANYVLTNQIYLRVGEWNKFLEKVDALLKGGGCFVLFDSIGPRGENWVKRFFEKKGYAVELKQENTKIRKSMRLTAKKPP